MIIRTAYKNIVGYGWRSLVNMLVISLVMIAMIWMQAMYHSWLSLAENQMIEWDIASGQFYQKDYDPYDVFSWDKSFAQIPEILDTDKYTPILVSPVIIYPLGRMTSVVAKGIPANQKIIKLPTSFLAQKTNEIPVMIGSVMAKNLRLNEGDVFTMRLRDVNGIYNAVDLLLVKIMNTPVPSLDAGQIWLDLEVLQSLRGLENMATKLIVSDESIANLNSPDWEFKSRDYLLSDLHEIRRTEFGQQLIIFALLLFLTMIAIFDTQMLTLFKRRKEIGTLLALGMQRQKIVFMFTVEGVLYMIFSVLMTAILGFPLFWYFAKFGYKMPDGFEDFGIAGMTETIKFSYPFYIVFSTVLTVFILTAVTSWFPARKITKLMPNDALRGKIK